MRKLDSVMKKDAWHLNQFPAYRRARAYVSALGVLQLHLRSPAVVAFFSFSFPGCGYLMQARYLRAFILIGWEVFINHHAKLNLGIMHALLGHFEKSKEVMDTRWLILYVGIYLFGIWDSYRITLDMNKQYILADREDAQIPNTVFSSWDFNYMDRREPQLALLWSALAPGVGHMYVHKIIAGFFLFVAITSLMYLSHIPQAIHYTLTGHFDTAKRILDMQWTLYLPSLYAFSIYDAYSSAVESNKLYVKEQARFLRTKYQNLDIGRLFLDRG